MEAQRRVPKNKKVSRKYKRKSKAQVDIDEIEVHVPNPTQNKFEGSFQKA
jgi:hypothetical protein